MSIPRYSHEFLVYLSSSPLVPNIDLCTPSSAKKKKSKKEEWTLEDEKFTFNSKGADAIEEFKLMMKSKEIKPVQEEVSVQKSRFLKFFDGSSGKEASTQPVPNLELHPVLTQEQQQFQRVMAMLARSTINPAEQHNPTNYQPNRPFYQPLEQGAPLMGYMPQMEYRPFPVSAPLSVPLSASQMQAPMPSQMQATHSIHASDQMSMPVVPMPVLTSAQITAGPMKPNAESERKAPFSESKVDPINAMLQSSIKAKKIQNSDIILEKLRK